MKVNLSTSEFKIVKEGSNVLKIVSAKAIPSGRPTQIEIKFEDKDGGSITSNYEFSNNKSMFVFTLLVQKLLGVTESTFDTDDLGKLVNKYVNVLIEHTNKPSTKNPGEVVTFANIKRIIDVAYRFEGEVEKLGQDAVVYDGLE